MTSPWVFLAFVACVFAAAFVQAVPQGRIVSGDEAIEGQFPYQISLRRENMHVCGGTIISARYILTAVHCVAEVPKTGRYILRKPEELTVQAGSIDRTKGGVVVEVSEVTAHEHYGFNLNDIAVIRLRDRLAFSKTIKAIDFATQEPPVNATVVVSGWGRLSDLGTRPDKLQYTNVRYMSTTECARKTQINGNQVLCMDHPLNRGPCKGDSGGPAAYQNKLVGINSFLIKGCGSEKPDMYVNVGTYLPWIRNHTDVV